MDWNEVGAIGQMIGSIAVFVTLIYLAIQAGHTRRELRRAVSQGMNEGWRQIHLARVANERVLGLSVKATTALGGRIHPFVAALMERAGLTREEAMALFLDQYASWVQNVRVINYGEELTQSERTTNDQGMRDTYGSRPLGRLWYETTKATLNRDAVRYIDNLLARPLLG